MPQHLSKMVMKDNDGHHWRLNYIEMNVVSWSAAQARLNEIRHSKGEVTKLKNKVKPNEPDSH